MGPPANSIPSSPDQWLLCQVDGRDSMPALVVLAVCSAFHSLLQVISGAIHVWLVGVGRAYTDGGHRQRDQTRRNRWNDV